MWFKKRYLIVSDLYGLFPEVKVVDNIEEVENEITEIFYEYSTEEVDEFKLDKLIQVYQLKKKINIKRRFNKLISKLREMYRFYH